MGGVTLTDLLWCSLNLSSDEDLALHEVDVTDLEPRDLAEAEAAEGCQRKVGGERLISGLEQEAYVLGSGQVKLDAIAAAAWGSDTFTWVLGDESVAFGGPEDGTHVGQPGLDCPRG